GGSDLGRVSMTCIAGDTKGKLWIGTKDMGVLVVEKKTGTVQRVIRRGAQGLVLPSDNVRCLLFASDGKLWVGTVDGLAVIEMDKRVSEIFKHESNNEQSHTHGSVYSLFEDKQQTMWVGTYFGGLNKVTLNLP